MQNLGHTANVLPYSYDKEKATMRKSITLTIMLSRPGKTIVLHILGYGMLKEALIHTTSLLTYLYDEEKTALRTALEWFLQLREAAHLAMDSRPWHS